MNERLPAEVIVTDLSDGVRYRLPGRSWGYPALSGLAAMIGGLLGTTFLSFWLWLVGSQLAADGLQGGGEFLLIFLGLGGFMLAMSLRLTLRGVTKLVGHSEIVLRGGTLRGVECWGPLRWGRRRPVDGLVRFDVRDASLDDRPGRVYEEPRAATEYNALTAVWDADAGTRRLQLARGYPRDWLLPLARELARRCQVAAAVYGTPDGPAMTTAIDVCPGPLPNAAGFVDLSEQPADSRVRVEANAAEMRLILPRGVFGGQQSVITVLGDRLRVDRGDRGGQTWTRRQLADIRVARQIDSEGPDTFQVHIEPQPGEGKRVRLTLGREAESRWLATTLRRALGMGDAIGRTPAPFLERAKPPAGCRIVRQPVSRGVEFIVPAAGYRHPDVRNYLLCAAGCLAVAIAVGGVLWAVGNSGEVDDSLGRLAVALWIIPAVLLLAAVGAVEEAVRRARRHATLTVIGDTLVIRQTTLYGERHREVRRSRIADVRVGDTLEGRGVNPRSRRAVLDRTDPTWELHVHLVGGEIIRLLDGYGDADLQWLATALRGAIGVPAAAVQPT